MKIGISYFNLDKIADSGQCFRWVQIGNGSYHIRAFGKMLKATQVTPDIIEVDCTPHEWARIWTRYFDLETDYGSIVATIDPRDTYLTAAAKSACGIRILRQELWETIASFIISQNNNIPRIKGTIQKLCSFFGSFPSANTLNLCNLESLRSVGLGYRAEYLAEAAARYLFDEPEELCSRMSLEESRMYFLTYNGIGPKVADCICLFGLGHKGAFPVDTWIKRIITTHYNGRFPIERYRPFAGVLQQFMFYHERIGGTAIENI